jgi:hypothetical protein
MSYFKATYFSLITTLSTDRPLKSINKSDVTSLTVKLTETCPQKDYPPVTSARVSLYSTFEIVDDLLIASSLVRK